MNGLSEVLTEEMPINRVVAECGECGMRLFDSVTSKKRSAVITGSIIEMETIAHREGTGHDDLEVSIDKPPTVTKEIDCTITVNG